MKDFDALIAKGYLYSPKEVFTCPNWDLARKLYNLNYLKEHDRSKQIIPKIIHQIWLGGKLPAQYAVYAETWKKHHPDWKYMLWTDETVNTITFCDLHLFNKAQNKGAKSDILRYELLKYYGGLYVDTDFECIKPFDDLLYLDFFTGLSYYNKMGLYIGLIAATPYYKVLNRTSKNVRVLNSYMGVREIMNLTGAYLFTDCFLEEIKTVEPGVVLFPMDYFYPFPNNVRKKGNPYTYVTDNTYAIHHWAVSWLANKPKYKKV